MQRYLFFKSFSPFCTILYAYLSILNIKSPLAPVASPVSKPYKAVFGFFFEIMAEH